MNSRPCITEENCIRAAKDSLYAEAEAIRTAADRLNGSLIQAVEIIVNHQGKTIITGIGKSGHIGQKIAATLCSTGTPAVFLHATEAVHGDLGIYTPGDPTIMICKSGATAELVRLVPILKEFKSPLIGIVGNINSPLARQMDVVLDGSVMHEADPLDLAPTSSSIVALAIGDALAAALVTARDFTEQDFARFHPSGQLGKSLLLHIPDIMHPLEKCGRVNAQVSIRQVVIALTSYPLGAVLVIDAKDRLLGIITDGDIRRTLQNYEQLEGLCAQDIMTPHPVCVSQDSSIKSALNLMENRASQISVLPVVNENQHCFGLLRIHDIYQTNHGE